MADKKLKRKTSAEQKKVYDQARSKTRVNIGAAFQRWRELREREGLRSDAEVAFFLLDRNLSAEERGGVTGGQLRTRGDEVNTEDVCGQSSVDVSDGSSTECLDSVWSSRDQSKPQPLLDKLSEQKSRHTQDSELSLTLLCYTDTNPTDAQHTVCDSNHTLNQDESTDQTSTESLDSVCNAGQQQILNTIPLNKCSVQLIGTDGKLMKTEPTSEEDQSDEDDDDDDDSDDDFFPSDESTDSCSEGETASTSEEYRGVKQNCVSSSNLNINMKTESDENPLYCSECDKCFSSKQYLIAHKRIHTGEKPYKCPHCDKRFNQEAGVKVHMRVHTNERPYQCSECGKTFTQIGSLQRHQMSHNDEKLYQCSHCDKRFNHKPNLMLHERTHTGEKPYLCSDCGMRFSQRSNFKDHQRTHTGERPYGCAQCGMSFSQSSTFKLHQRVHSGEKPYPCNVCGKSFNRRDNLKTHQRLHTGEKPYKCSQCDKAFTQRVLLKLHQKVHTGEKPGKT